MKRVKHLIPQEQNELEPEKKITRLAIGLEGGFQVENSAKYEYEEKNSVSIFPGPKEIELPNPNLPAQVINTMLNFVHFVEVHDYW